MVAKAASLACPSPRPSPVPGRAPVLLTMRGPAGRLLGGRDPRGWAALAVEVNGTDGTDETEEEAEEEEAGGGLRYHERSR